MSVLLRAEQIAGTADFQITHSNLKACAQLRKITDSLQTLFSNFAERLIRLIHKVSISKTRAASYTATHLVELRKAEVVGTVDNNRIRQRYVQTVFHNRRTQKHVAAALIEGNHGIL